MPPKTDQYSKAALFLSKAARQGGYSTVLFASTRRGEGTSTVVRHVARELKETYGLNPLVVEVRPPKSGLRRILNVGARPVEEPVEVAKAANGAFRQLGSISPIVVTCEEPEDRKKGGVSSVLTDLFREIETEYDIVLVDVPPLLEFADGIDAGHLVPRIFLVVEAGRTHYEVLDRVKSDLAAANIEILGVILNKHRRFIPGWIYRLFMH